MGQSPDFIFEDNEMGIVAFCWEKALEAHEPPTLLNSLCVFYGDYLSVRFFSGKKSLTLKYSPRNPENVR